MFQILLFTIFLMFMSVIFDVHLHIDVLQMVVLHIFVLSMMVGCISYFVLQMVVVFHYTAVCVIGCVIVSHPCAYVYLYFSTKIILANIPASHVLIIIHTMNVFYSPLLVISTVVTLMLYFLL